jgi:hypothetical protein
MMMLKRAVQSTAGRIPARTQVKVHGVLNPDWGDDGRALLAAAWLDLDSGEWKPIALLSTDIEKVAA